MSCKNGITGAYPVEAGGILENMLSEKNYDNWPLETKKGKDGKTTEADRIKQVVRYFMEKTDMPSEFAIAVAGVWSAESHVAPWRYNSTERDRGGNFIGISPGSRYELFGGEKYFYNEQNMKLFGYGKGVAQWSWTRNLKFAEWYNGASGVKTENLPTMDKYGSDIIKTDMTTQTAYAWLEMSARMKNEFKNIIDKVKSNHVNPDEDFNLFQENIMVSVDVVLRGFENGAGGKLASESQMNKYKADGGYLGSLRRRVGGAMAAYDVIKSDPDFASYLS